MKASRGHLGVRCWTTLGALLAALVLPSIVQAESTVTDFNAYPNIAPRFYSGSEVVVSASSTASYLRLDLGGDLATLEVHTGTTEPLQTGIYPYAVNFDYHDPPAPYLRMDRCDSQNGGHFEIRDIARDADGKLQRLWMIYQAYCYGQTEIAEFGEVRIDQPDETGPLSIPSRILRWPETDLGLAPATVEQPVTFTGAATIAGVSILGDDAAAFDVTSSCTGRAFVAGDTCSLGVSHRPMVGTRRAILRVATTAGYTRDISLEGFTYGGVTRVEEHSSADDPIGRGDYVFTRPRDRVSGGGSTREAGAGGTRVDGSSFGVLIAPPSGGRLVPGNYLGVRRFPFNDADAGMQITGCGERCYQCNSLNGQFIIREVTFDPLGVVRTLGASFSGRCEESHWPTIAGDMSIREGDTTPLAPWMGGPELPPTAAAAPEPPPATTTAPAPDVAAMSGPPPPAQATARQSSRCSTNALRLSMRRIGASGNRGYQLSLRNRSKRSCTLRGFPGVALLDARHRQIGRTAARTGKRTARVTLRPGQAGVARLRVDDVRCPGQPARGTSIRPRQARYVRVTPPRRTDRAHPRRASERLQADNHGAQASTRHAVENLPRSPAPRTVDHDAKGLAARIILIPAVPHHMTSSCA